MRASGLDVSRFGGVEVLRVGMDAKGFGQAALKLARTLLDGHIILPEE